MKPEPLSLDAAKRYIEQIDLAPVVERMMREYPWSKRTILKACEQYRHYLYLMKKHGEQYILTPSKEMDEVWHNHILYTEQYHKDSDYLFGKYMHHRPDNTPLTSFISDKEKIPFSKMQKLYKEEFGDYIYQIKPGALQRVVIYIYRRTRSFCRSLIPTREHLSVPVNEPSISD